MRVPYLRRDGLYKRGNHKSALFPKGKDGSLERVGRNNSKGLRIRMENNTVQVRTRGASVPPEGASKIFVYAAPTTSNPTLSSAIPTTSLETDATLAPTSSAGPSSPPSTIPTRTTIKIVITNAFYVSNNVGLTSVNFSESTSIYKKLNGTYNSLLELLYPVDETTELIGSSIVNVQDFPCELSATGGTLCQKVKANHTVALIDSDVDVNKTYDKLMTLIDASVGDGKLQELLVAEYPDSHLTIRKEIDDVVEVVVRNSFLLKDTEFVNEVTLQPESNAYRLLQDGYEFMNSDIVTSSNVSDIAYVPKSATLMKIVGINCPENSDSLCQNVSASYNVTVAASSGADAQLVLGRLSNLTLAAITSGNLQDVLHVLNSSVPFRTVDVNGSSPIPLESDVEADASEGFETDAADLAIDVTFSFAVSLDSAITIGGNLIQQLRWAVANISAGYNDESLGTTLQGSGRLDFFVPIICPSDNGYNGVPTGNDTTSNNRDRRDGRSDTPIKRKRRSRSPSDIFSEGSKGNETPATTKEGAGGDMTSLDETTATLPPGDNTTEPVSVNETVPNRRELAVSTLRKATEVVQKGVGESHCFTLFGSFKVQPLHSNVSTLAVQQEFTERFERKLFNGELQRAMQSRPVLSHLRTLGDQGLKLARPAAAKIQSAFTILSPVPLRPEDLESGGSTRNKLELAFSTLIEVILGKSSLSYLEGSSNIEDIDDARCPTASSSGNHCYLVEGSYAVRLSNSADEAATKGELGAATKQAIDDGELQKSSIQIYRFGSRPSVQPPSTPSPFDPSNTGKSPPTQSEWQSVEPSNNLDPSITPTTPRFPSAVPSTYPSKIQSLSPSAILSRPPSHALSVTPPPSSRPSHHLPPTEPEALGLSTVQEAPIAITAGSYVALAMGILLLCLCGIGIGLGFGYKKRQKAKDGDPDDEKIESNPFNTADFNTFWDAECKMIHPPLQDHTDVEWDFEDSTSLASPSESSATQDPSVVESAASTGHGGFSIFRRKAKDEKVKFEKDSDMFALDKCIHSVQVQDITDAAWGYNIDEEDLDVFDACATGVPEISAKTSSSLGTKLAKLDRRWNSMTDAHAGISSFGLPKSVDAVGSGFSRSYSDSSEGSTYISFPASGSELDDTCADSRYDT
ncbi:hypothetical protein MHU86_4837 [Fragilaria crotonensis]|nr:hypothetical protein MHU86_4837 [Fragilaria crotonensis]